MANQKLSNFVIFLPHKKKMPFVPRIKILDLALNGYAILEILV